MLEAAITWLLGHPLQGVGCLAGLAVIIGLVAVEGLHNVTGHGHPRT
jgi:hypothetical protein